MRAMRSITIELDDETVEHFERMATREGITLNQFLEGRLRAHRLSPLDRLFAVADKVELRSEGGFLTRDEANAR